MVSFSDVTNRSVVANTLRNIRSIGISTNLGKMHHHIRIDGRKVEQIIVVKLQLIRP